MRNPLLIMLFFILFATCSVGHSQDVIFLHHSVGYNFYVEGNILSHLDAYNSAHGTSYTLTQLSYPNLPYRWENYPYDYWNLWLNNGCDNSDSDIECLNGLCSKYDVIVFKHCFTVSDIYADDPVSSISSMKNTLGNYKLQYRALRDLMDTYPNNKFIVWTLAPNHRLATNDADSERARQFVDWVKNEWLSEDGKNHPNIFIFDFWGYVAESNPSPVNGQVNRLRYEYEISHTDKNSHPNALANETVGPLFVEFVVNTIENVQNVKITGISITGEGGSNTIATYGGTLQLSAEVSPASATNKTVTWSVQNGTGQASITADGLVTAMGNGTVTAIATATDGSGISGSLDITISGQTVAVTSITVTGADGANTITIYGGTLQLSATVNPVDATNNTVTWSLQNGTGEASIDADGLVTAVSDGTVIATATAADGSGVSGNLTITIENQVIPTGIPRNKPEPAVISMNSRQLKVQSGNNFLEGTLSIFNMVGSPVFSGQLNNNIKVFDVSGLPSGIYIVLLRNQTGSVNSVKVSKP